MAPPIILEDQEDIYHYLVVMKEHLNHSYFSSIGEVPVSVIDLITSTHEWTGFLDDWVTQQPSIQNFFVLWILTPPGNTFDFNYLTNYPGVSSQGTILSTAASSLGSASSLIFSSNTPTNINFNVMTISGLNNPKYYFIEVNGGTNKFNGNIDSVFDYNILFCKF